jgi:dTDP-4-dehydrorhamnose reductase
VRVLVTGAAGMLGSTLVERWRARHDVYATARTPFDAPGWSFRAFDLGERDHRPLTEWARPDVIVHCAAWTALDECEAAPERTLELNGRSVARLLDAAPGARMIFISSEAVLGDRSGPLGEEALPQPLNAYARGKLLGETLLRERDAGVTVRTTVIGWNRDPRKQSFVEWLVRSLERGESITLFRDALFDPIAAPLLADELEVVMTDPRKGLWHVSGRESLSKLELGLKLCARLGLDHTKIREGSIAEARFRARRSADQRLSVASYERDFGRRLPTVDATIEAVVTERES